MKDCKRKNVVWREISRIEYETDQIKDQNSSLEVQNRNLVYAIGLLTILGLSIYIIKLKKLKQRVLYKQTAES
jgi:hypothetical protein